MHARYSKITTLYMTKIYICYLSSFMQYYVTLTPREVLPTSACTCVTNLDEGEEQSKEVERSFIQGHSVVEDD